MLRKNAPNFHPGGYVVWNVGKERGRGFEEVILESGVQASTGRVESPAPHQPYPFGSQGTGWVRRVELPLSLHTTPKRLHI